MEQMSFKKPLGPNGTVIRMVPRKAGRAQNTPPAENFMQLFDILVNIVDLGSHFGAHWIL